MFSITIYTRKFLGLFEGTNFLFFIFINPDYKDDKALLVHEKTHVDQMWLWWFWSAAIIAVFVYLTKLDSAYYLLCLIGAGAHSLMYHTIKKYRLHAESEAYAEQVKAGINIKVAAYFLSNRYGLDINAVEAENSISMYI